MIKLTCLFLFVLTLAFGFMIWTGTALDQLISSSMGFFTPLVIITAAGSWFLVSHIDSISKDVSENDDIKREVKKGLLVKFRELKDEVVSNVFALVALLVIEGLTTIALEELRDSTHEYVFYITAGLDSTRVACLISAIFIVWNQLSSFKHVNKFREVIV